MSSAYYLAQRPQGRSSSWNSAPPPKIIADIETIADLYKHDKLPAPIRTPAHPPNPSFNTRISFIRTDITTLATDAIVNAANSRLAGGSGVDGAIHAAAGPKLLAECALLEGCETGDAKITDAYELPSQRVIHAVGPIYAIMDPDEAAELLAGCYTAALRLAVEHQCKSVAFPALSTGVYGYPSADACEVALGAVRRFFEEGEGAESIERVVFCNFLLKDEKAYEETVGLFFPPADESVADKVLPVDEAAVIPEKPELVNVDSAVGGEENPTDILSQLPDAPTTDPIDPPAATGPEPKKQKTEEPDTDDEFVFVEREEAKIEKQD